MENNLQIFTHDLFGDVRTITNGNTVLFCGSDIAKALGYTNPRKAVRDHTRGGTKCSIPTTSGAQEMTFVPEGDIYRLIARSKLPEADKFERWVFDDVLPTIRSTGGYVNNHELFVDEYFSGLDLTQKTILSNLLESSSRQKRELAQAQLKIQTDAPKVQFAEDVQAAEGNMLVREVARILTTRGIKTGGNKLYQYLRDNNIVDSENVAYQEYINRGYFQVAVSWYKVNGVKVANKTTYVTPKGLVWLHGRLSKQIA